jgi:hypothetical protein
MATAVLDPARAEVPPLSALELVRAFADFLSAVASIASVQRVAYWSGGGQFELWVLLREDVLEDAERVFLLDRDFRQSPAVFPFELHVVALSDVDEANLPPTKTLVERS